MTKLDWRRAQPGNQSADEKMGVEWSRGPQDDFSIGRDDAMQIDFYRSPDIYWTGKLRKAFPQESVEAHRELRAAARRAAAEVYKNHGVNTLMSRTQAYYARASGSNPWPSAYFACYFDASARAFATKTKRHDPPARRNTDKFYHPNEMYARCYVRCRKIIEDVGGFEGFAKRLFDPASHLASRRVIEEASPEPSAFRP